MGILDGVSGVKELSKSDLLVDYLAQGLCQSIEEDPKGNFRNILNQGYLKACTEASNNLLLFPPTCKLKPSQYSSSTLTFVQASCDAETTTGPHQGKFAVRIFTLGDSAVLVYRPTVSKSSLTSGQCIESVIEDSSGKKKHLRIPGQISLYHGEYIQKNENFSFDNMCTKLFREKLNTVRKYEEHYLDSGDFIIAGSDGLWDNLNKYQIIEILKKLTKTFPEEYLTNRIPYAFIIAEIAKYLSVQPEGKFDDISVVVNRIGHLDVIIDSTIIQKYQQFINENSSFFTSTKKKVEGLFTRIKEPDPSSMENKSSGLEIKKRKVLPIQNQEFSESRN